MRRQWLAAVANVRVCAKKFVRFVPTPAPSRWRVKDMASIEPSSWSWSSVSMRKKLGWVPGAGAGPKGGSGPFGSGGYGAGVGDAGAGVGAVGGEGAGGPGAGVGVL
jgi:hypothetical protein